MAVAAPHGSLWGRRITDIAWAVDVVLSTSAVAPVRLNATPIVAVSLTLDDGRVLAFRLRQEELHQWRYTLARAYKDVAYLERKRPQAPSKRR